MEEEVFTFSFKEVPYIGLDLVSCHTSYKEGLEMLYFTKEKEKMHSDTENDKCLSLGSGPKSTNTSKETENQFQYLSFTNQKNVANPSEHMAPSKPLSSLCPG